MKKLFTFICAMAMIAVYADNVVVGDNSYYNFVAIEDKPLGMLKTMFGDTTLIEGEYQTGYFIKRFSLYSQKAPEGYVEPDTAYAYFNLQDMYDGELYKMTDHIGLGTFFDQIEYTDANTITPFLVFTQERGGQYSTSFGIQPLDYSTSDTIIIKGEPSLKTNNYSTKIGDDFDIKVYFNTGYPFEMDSLTGNERAKYTIYKSLTDSTMVATEYTDSMTLNLKDEAHPLIAGVDTMSIFMPRPELGKYFLKITSDWAKGNQTFVLSVQDTISVTTSFDKKEYIIGTDKSAKLNVHMEYGYPYIQSKDSLPPTITLKTTLLNVKDSVVLSSDTLSSKKLNHDQVLDIDLSNITNEYLTAHHDSVILELNILFSGEERYSNKFLLPIKSSSTGIKNVAKAVADKKSIYTIQGVKLNCTKEALRKGVYIIDGKKEIVK